jgi:nucleotide-binding universal stress UspA family protein
MEIKQILLVMTADASGDAAVETAARLARGHGAKVDGVCLFQEPEPEMAECFAEGAEAIGEVLDRRLATVKALTAPGELAFRKALVDRGLAEGWTVGEIDEWTEAVIERARLADLVVVARPEQHAAYRRLTENLAIRAGTPCLVVPSPVGEPRDFERVVVAWNGTREAKRAMIDALPFLKRASAVRVLAVREDARPSPTAAQTEALTHLLARHGVSAEVVCQDGAGKPTGAVLLRQCQAFGADLLVMGAFGHSRAAETILGGATRTILADASLPTLLSH